MPADVTISGPSWFDRLTTRAYFMRLALSLTKGAQHERRFYVREIRSRSVGEGAPDSLHCGRLALAEEPDRGLVHGEEALDPNLLDRDVLRRSERGNGREKAQRDVCLA